MIKHQDFQIKPGMSDREVALAYSKHFGLPFVELKNITIPPELINIIPKNIIESFKIIPYQRIKDQTDLLKIAVADPRKLQQKAPEAIIDLKKKGISISLAVTTETDFRDAFKRLFNKEEEKDVTAGKSEDHNQQNTVPYIKLIGQKIPRDVLAKLPQEVAEKYLMVVFEAPQDTNKIKVAALNPEDKATGEILDFIRDRNHLEIDLFKTSRDDLEYALKLYQEKSDLQISTSRGNLTTDLSHHEQPLNPVKPISSIPLAKPLPELESKSDLPPLNLQKKPPEQVESKINKPTGTAQVSSQELAKSHDQTNLAFEPVAEEEENNLDSLFPSGINDETGLINVIKSGIVPKIVAAIIFYATQLDASDIHLEPSETDFRLRYRIDGILREIMRMPSELHAPVTSRIKIISKLKIDEQRIPQDGRFDVIASKKDIDLRVSTFPTIYGEKVVMRILDKSGGIKKIEDLGFTGTNLQRLDENISKPHGIILATGPTGSGKSTTLYAILNKISKPEVNVVTLEDPVEYNIPGVNQCQIKPKIGFSFAEGLKSILRQDPNIIMVGEIRDSETASMSTHAALTGHLVLTTLHTNDAAGALPRLINMGVEPFLITSSINCIVAQRLVRKLCDHCKEAYTPPEPLVKEIKEELGQSKDQEVLEYHNKPLKFFRKKGCKQCTQGYKGRLGIYEVLIVSGEIENLTVHKEPASKIRNQAIEEGMVTMKQDGIIKAANGLTSLEEVLRVTSGD